MPRWKAGESGNPQGRPKGALSRYAKFRESLAKDLPGVLEALLAAAKGGDVAAARVILDRVIPPLRAVDLPVNVPALEGAATLTDKGAAVLGEVAAGRLAPSEAASLLGALATQARLVEITEIVRRVEALEAHQNDHD